MTHRLLNLSIAVLLISTSACQNTASPTPEVQQLADFINSLNIPWIAAAYIGLDFNNVRALLGRLGGALDPLQTSTITRPLASNGFTNALGNLGRRLQTANYPASLDLRVNYPACRSISYIREQGQCGACWAFSTMNSLSDRFCIANYNNGSPTQRFFSPQDTLECCTTCAVSPGSPCNGGYLTTAFAHVKNTGVSTGEEYNNFKLCKPYFLSGSASSFSQPTCKNGCGNPNIYKVLLNRDRKKISNYNTGKGEAAMIAALNSGGSIVVTFNVYKDFYLYKSGVYSYQGGSSIGLHDVRMIGYGSANGVNYWLCANSWDSGWGEKGFFRIRRGTDECGIESNLFGYGII